MNNPEHEKMWAALNRVNELGNRLSAEACRKVVTSNGTRNLDTLLTLIERTNRLFWRIHKRYEAS